MDIIDFYKSILSTGNLVADKDGFISAQMSGATVPYCIDDKRLVLPLRDQLANPDWATRVVFHPLSENFMRDESAVMSKFRSAINIRLNWVIGSLMTELFTLALSVDEHKKMSPAQAKILTTIKDIDDKTVHNFGAMVKAIGLTNKDKSFAHIYLKRSGVINKKTYTRAAIIDFPFYNELKKKEKTVYGLTVRGKDREAYIAMLEFLIPNIGKEQHFNKGSESDVAPFLDALMMGLVGIAGNINTTVDNYSSYLSDTSKFLYEADWVEVFDNLTQMLPAIRAIPMMSGNEGTTAAEVKANQAKTLSVGTQINNVVPAMVQNNQVAVTTSGPVLTSNGGIDFSATIRNNPALNNSFAFNGNQQPVQGPAALRSGMINANGFSGGQPQVATYFSFQQPQQQFVYSQQMQQQPMGFGMV